jgi:hypothetical protein
MSEHHRNVVKALHECGHGVAGSNSSAVSHVANLAAEANRARFAESIRAMGASLPFRKDDRTRERQIQDVLRLAHLAAQSRKLQRPHAGDEPPSPDSAPAGCGSGWSPILRQGDEQFPIGAQLVEKPADASLPPDQNGGYSGTSARALANNSSITIGAVIGDYCDLRWTPPDQRIQMGVYEGATISTSWGTFYDLNQPLSARAPNALMAKAAVLRTQALPYMIAGDPTGPGGGLIWCYATTSLDVYIGLNLTGEIKLPHASAEACLWNRMGTPFFDDVSYNGVNGNWDTKIDVFDDGDVSNPVLSASLGGTGLPDQILLVTISVNVCCLRYPESSGFVGVLFQNPLMTPLVVTPDTTWQAANGVYPQTAPIQVQSISLCGI